MNEEQIIENLVKIVDDVLPQASKIVIDIGLVNDTLINARKFLLEKGINTYD